MKLIGLGAGGHTKVVIEIVRNDPDNELIGLLDRNQALWGSLVLGVPVLGGDDLLPELHASGVRHCYIGLGAVGDTRPRRELYERARRLGFEVVTAIHPDAVVSKYAEIGHGPTIMAGAVINASAQIGDNVVVNTGAIVEHDCVIGDHVFVASGARLASTVRVGEGAHIGLGASIRQCIDIGPGATVGAGAVVIASVAENTTVVGVPARVLRGAR